MGRAKELFLNLREKEAQQGNTIEVAPGVFVFVKEGFTKKPSKSFVKIKK